MYYSCSYSHIARVEKAGMLCSKKVSMKVTILFLDRDPQLSLSYHKGFVFVIGMWTSYQVP